MVGRVFYRDGADQERIVELLKSIHGVKLRRRIFEEAVTFEGEDDLPTVRILHPVMQLETRVANVVDLERYRTPEGILQAKIAAEIAREWLLDQLGVGWKTAQQDIERVLALAESKPGAKAAAAHGIDILAAVPSSHSALPERFGRTRLPQARRTVEAAIARARRTS